MRSNARIGNPGGEPVAMKCPKDQSPMRSYERSGITVERCSECGGIFLDRGELERLMAIEAGAGNIGHREYAGGGHDDEGDDGYGGRRRRGWLGDLLDFG